MKIQSVKHQKESERIMKKREMWSNFIALGKTGLWEEFKKLSEEEIASMSVDECIHRCYVDMMTK